MREKLPSGALALESVVEREERERGRRGNERRTSYVLLSRKIVEKEDSSRISSFLFVQIEARELV